MSAESLPAAAARHGGPAGSREAQPTAASARRITSAGGGRSSGGAEAFASAESPATDFSLRPPLDPIKLAAPGEPLRQQAAALLALDPESGWRRAYAFAHEVLRRVPPEDLGDDAEYTDFELQRPRGTGSTDVSEGLPASAPTGRAPLATFQVVLPQPRPQLAARAVTYHLCTATWDIVMHENTYRCKSIKL